MKWKCAFCSEDAVETGGEHVWDNWINKALPPDLTYLSRKRLTQDSPLIERDTDRIDEKFPVVCNTCNHGWMSLLTEKVRIAFGRAMLDGEPFFLGARDAAVLSAFVFMKAVVTNHLVAQQGAYEPFFTRAVRERLRVSLALPPSVKCWFAVCEWESYMSTRNNLSILNTVDPGPLSGIELCCHSYIVGKLALQMLAPRWKDISNMGRPLSSITPNSRWNNAAILFWPHPGTSLSWPPPEYLVSDTIKAFIHRFQNKVEFTLRQSVGF
jgi:hypothetical protein